MRDNRITALIVAAAVMLTGCAAGGDGGSPTPAVAVTVEDPLAAAADTGMTAMFGRLTNGGDRDAVVIGGDSPAAGRVEVHEVAAGPDGVATMRPKLGGITIPAGGSHELSPGGDHLMLMDLTAPLRPGDDVSVTVIFADGTRLPVTAQVRDFVGADEEYAPGGHGHG